MTTPERKIFRCAIYTRKSTEHNLDLEFNSLDAQREACEAYIKSQAHEGWRLVPDRYDDGGLSGASLDRAALQKLLADVGAGRITIVVVYKVDRLTRSLADFAKLVELFDQHGVSFVSITQSFNTTSSMGRRNRRNHPRLLKATSAPATKPRPSPPGRPWRVVLDAHAAKLACFCSAPMAGFYSAVDIRSVDWKYSASACSSTSLGIDAVDPMLLVRRLCCHRRDHVSIVVMNKVSHQFEKAAPGKDRRTDRRGPSYCG